MLNMKNPTGLIPTLTFVCLFLASTPGSMSATNQIEDLELISVFVGNKKDLTNDDGSTTDKDYLVVNLKTRSNLLDIRSTPSTIWVDFYFCDDPETVVFVEETHVFVGELNLSKLPSTTKLGSTLKHGRLTYRVFIPLKSHIDAELHKSFRRRKSQTNYATYDLTQNPRDLCVFLHGGSSSGFYFQSNAVLISKDRVAELVGGP